MMLELPHYLIIKNSKVSKKYSNNGLDLYNYFGWINFLSNSFGEVEHADK